MIEQEERKMQVTIMVYSDEDIVSSQKQQKETKC